MAPNQFAKPEDWFSPDKSLIVHNSTAALKTLPGLKIVRINNIK